MGKKQGKQKHKSKRTRKFNGKTFSLHSAIGTRHSADRLKEKLKKEGKYVRVIPGTKKDIKYEEAYWRVFYR